MSILIRRNLSQLSFIAFAAFSLTGAAYALSADATIENDSSNVAVEYLSAPATLDEDFAEQEMNEYTPQDYSELDHRQITTACYTRDWKGHQFVAYSANHNARKAQRQAIQKCQQTSVRCEPMGCRREWLYN